MKRPVVLALAAATILSGAAVAAPVPDQTPRTVTAPKTVVSSRNPAARPVSLDRLFEVHAGSGGIWSADGRSVIYSSDLGGRLNLWRQAVAGGAPQPIAKSDDREEAAVATRDGRWVIFESDHGGREIFDLYAVSPNGGAITNLTNSDDVSETSPVTSWDSRFLAFQHRVKSEPSANAAVMDLNTRKVRLLTHESDPSRQWNVVAFSRDGRRVIANRADISQSYGAVYSIDLQSGETTRLTTDDGKAYASASDISPDSRVVALTVETADGRKQAALLDLASGKVRDVLPSPWEQGTGRFSPDGLVLMLASNVDGRDSVYAYDLRTRHAHALPLPAGSNEVPDYSPRGDRLLFAHQSGSTPPDYWVSDASGTKAHPVTEFGKLPAGGAAPTRIVHYRSADGTMVSAILWTPFNLPRNGKAAGVVLAHGGPTGQTTDSFNRTATALASRGYFVIAPNPRGSTGYGKAFMAANRNDLGGGDLEDEVAGATFLAATGYVDIKRIGITGGSYGGYMTLMAVAKTPDVWAAGVEEYGIVNWRTMYEHGSPVLRFYQAGLIGTPDANPKVYDATSPLTYLSQVRAPLLVLQGENDPRVPAEEARQVVEFLHNKGRVVDSHFYPDEGHGFSKPEDQKDALRRTIDWFDKYLK